MNEHEVAKWKKSERKKVSIATIIKTVQILHLFYNTLLLPSDFYHGLLPKPELVEPLKPPLKSCDAVAVLKVSC